MFLPASPLPSTRISYFSTSDIGPSPLHSETVPFFSWPRVLHHPQWRPATRGEPLCDPGDGRHRVVWRSWLGPGGDVGALKPQTTEQQVGDRGNIHPPSP